MGEFITIGLFLASPSFIEELICCCLWMCWLNLQNYARGTASAYVLFAAQQAQSLFSVTNTNVMLPTLLNTSMCASVWKYETFCGTTTFQGSKLETNLCSLLASSPWETLLSGWARGPRVASLPNRTCLSSWSLR